MTKKPSHAQTAYEAAVDQLTNFCFENTDLSAVIQAEEYPFRVQFIPEDQLSLFGNENVTENGEFNDMTVAVGLTTTVKNTLKFKMDSKQLKKLIKLAETVGTLYYQAYREAQGARNTPLPPFLKALDGFDPEVASELCCPGCGHPIVNQWAPGTKPHFCQGCGQAIDWEEGTES